MQSKKAEHGDLNVRSLDMGGIKWIDIQEPSTAEMAWLKDNYAFHPLALDNYLNRAQMPKIDNYGTYLFAVLQFPVFDHHARITLPAEVDIFVGPDYVVTVHNGGLMPLIKLFNDYEATVGMRPKATQWSSGYLLYTILDVLVDYCLPILGKVSQNVDNVEFRVFDELSQRLVREISIIRRDIIAYRRIIRPQIAVLESLERKEHPFLKVNPDVYFGDLADHARRIWSELEELKEVIESLGDAHNTLTSHQTNLVMRVLTVISTILLPLTLISGLYGMNVGLPREHAIRLRRCAGDHGGYRRLHASVFQVTTLDIVCAVG